MILQTRFSLELLYNISCLVQSSPGCSRNFSYLEQSPPGCSQDFSHLVQSSPHLLETSLTWYNLLHISCSILSGMFSRLLLLGTIFSRHLLLGTIFSGIFSRLLSYLEQSSPRIMFILIPDLLKTSLLLGTIFSENSV